MDINSIPTDNLYKFISLSGLFIIALSIYYPNEVLIESTQNEVSLLNRERELYYNLKWRNEEFSEMTDRLKLLSQQLEAISAEYEDLINKKKKNTVTLNEFDNYGRAISLKKNKVDSLGNIVLNTRKELLRLSDKLELEQQKIENERILIDLNKDIKTKYTYLLYLGSVIGLIAITYGFKKWYSLQKAMDKKILKK